MGIENIQFESGYMVLVKDQGPPLRVPMTEVLRALDIPDLTIDSLTLLSTLAQVVMVLTKTLVEQDVIGEELVSGFDLPYVLDTLIDDLSAEEV